MDLWVILAMATITYALRMSGYWAMGRIPLTPFMVRALEALPGAVITATLAPLAISGGISGATCLGVTATLRAIKCHEFLAVVAGIASAALIRALS